MCKFKMDFYKGKKIFVTGHTGFKGAWLCRILIGCGAEVTGYALQPPTEPSLFQLAGIAEHINSITGDIRDLKALKAAFDHSAPDIVIHMAAQPLVRESYNQPQYTYETNVMGTVNLLDCIRLTPGNVKSILNVTTDKVYRNNEWEWGYRETDPLGGYDPYSNSKSCSELVSQSYKDSFFNNMGIALSTARAGNVIGGGDFAGDRIIPDCVRAAAKNENVILRNPNSIRPYQHVLDPLFAYLMIAQVQYVDPSQSGAYNIGPNEQGCITTGQLAEMFCREIGSKPDRRNMADNGPHEANFLKLDCAKAKTVFSWQPRWDIEQAVKKTAEWTKVYLSKGDISACMDRQISEFLGEA